MAKGRDASDWTVRHDGDEGTIACPEYRGRFRVLRSGVVQIVWHAGGPGPGEDGPVNRAAGNHVGPEGAVQALQYGVGQIADVEPSAAAHVLHGRRAGTLIRTAQAYVGSVQR